MKHVMLLVLLLCTGCSSMHNAAQSTQEIVSKGAVLLAVGVALQTDIAGKDLPKTGNYRDLTGIVNMLGNDWRRNARLLTNR